MSTRYVSIDEMLTYVGGYGPYQWMLDAIFSIIQLPQTFQILIMYFAALSPTWQCAANSTSCLSNATFASGDRSRCAMKREDWVYTQPRDFSVATQYDLVCSNEWIISLTSAIFFIGWIFGSIVLGWIADRFGRKTVYFPCTAVMIVSGFISAFSPSIVIFLMFRFISGFTKPGTSLQAYILISEIVDGSHRALAGMLIWAAFTFAVCIVGVKAYFIRQWKLLLIVCTAPYIFVLLFYPLVPESLRWLRLNKKTGELKKISLKMAKWNRKKLPENILISTENLKENHKANPLDLFRTKKTAIRTLVQGYAWIVNGMVYYGLSLAADDLGGSLYLNYILVNATEFPAIVTAIHFCNRFGRKRTITRAILIGSISCITIAFIPLTGKIKYARVVLAILGKNLVSVSFDAIYTWSVELFPTETRGEGMGFLQVASRIGAASSPFIAKGLKTIHHSAPFITMGSVGIIGFFLQLILPETKDVPMKETNNEIEMSINHPYDSKKYQNQESNNARE